MKVSREEILSELHDRRDFSPAAKRIRIILENIKNRRQLILDAGCGLGWVSFFLQKQGRRTVMIDLSRHMLARCSLMKSELGLASPLIRGTLTDLPFKDEAFDVCVLLDVLEHIPALSRCMSEVSRVLTAKGKLLMTTPNKFGIYSGIYDLIGKRLFGTRISDHVHRFSIEDVQKMLYDRGFGIQKVERIEFMSPLFHMVSRDLKHGRELVCRLSQIDVMLSDFLCQKRIVSEWFLVALKR